MDEPVLGRAKPPCAFIHIQTKCHSDFCKPIPHSFHPILFLFSGRASFNCLYNNIFSNIRSLLSILKFNLPSFIPSFKMKCSIIFSASLFAAYISAAPTTITITVDDNSSAAAAAVGGPFQFTRSFNVVAIPSEVRNGTVEVTGAADATGYFNYGLNSASDTICYVSYPSPLPNDTPSNIILRT